MEYYENNKIHNYLPISEIKKNVQKQTQKARKNNPTIKSVEATAHQRSKISSSFLSSSWSKHIESYTDNLQPMQRGRSLLRAGGVLDFHIEGCEVRAKVLGEEIYEVFIRFKPLEEEDLQEFKKKAKEHLGSFAEILSSSFSKELEELIAKPETGLFAERRQMSISCNCLDDRDLCPHAAAALYGIGIKSEDHKGLFFSLRGLDPKDLFDSKEEMLDKLQVSGNSLKHSDLEKLFDIELEESP